MTAKDDLNRCRQSDLLGAYALHALPVAEASALQAHLATCPDCRRELDGLAPVVDSMAYWPVDVLRPPRDLQQRLAARIAVESGSQLIPPPSRKWAEPDWEDVAPGISCKLLAEDRDRSVVTMLVRLAANCEYPPHTHAAVEELHLLDGELWIDDRKLYPGDYNRAEPGTSDARVWSETGCTCLLITSTRDVLR